MPVLFQSGIGGIEMARERFSNALGAVVTYGVYREVCRSELRGMGAVALTPRRRLWPWPDPPREISPPWRKTWKCRPTEVDFINGAVVKYGENSAEAQPKTRGAGPGYFHEPRPRGQWRRGEGVSPQEGNPPSGRESALVEPRIKRHSSISPGQVGYVAERAR
ncbi:MAG: hypothetical protein QW086_01375 [Pyrobaculum sp.]